MEQVKHSRLRHRNNNNQLPPGSFLNKYAGGQQSATEDPSAGSSQQPPPPQEQVNYRQEEKRILDRILAQEVYDTRMRPLGINSTDGPTIVNVNLYVRSFEKIDDVKMVSSRF